nr:DUF368 domain-containing protein [Halalkalibacter urbisdiaboli]
MFKWMNIFKGIAMGVSDLIPGVSGGTIALLLGIYQTLVAAINGVFTKKWKEHLLFLIPIGLGIGIALVSLSRLIEWLLSNYPQPTFFFFLGLTVAIIPTLLKEIKYKESFQLHHYLLVVFATILVASTAIVKEDKMTPIMKHLEWSDYVFLFISGWLASSAMILPGISGSFVLLLLGVYPTIINALSTLNLHVLAFTGSGIVIGLILTTKLITYLFNMYRVSTYAIIIGFIIGSTIVIYPGMVNDPLLFILSVTSFIVGFLVVFSLSKFENTKV